MADVFTIESGALPASARVLAFTATEGLSTLYRVEVHVLVHQDAMPTLDLRGMIAQRGTLHVNREDGSPRMTFHGVIASAELLHEVEAEGLYKLTLMPRVWHLTLNRHSRVFADRSIYKNIGDVIKKVMTLNGLAERTDYELRLRRTYKAWDHICQYKETDFDFSLLTMAFASSGASCANKTAKSFRDEFQPTANMKISEKTPTMPMPACCQRGMPRQVATS